MGEEYVRRLMVLGSVPSLGPVIMFDDIEDLFKWIEGGTGGDTVFEKSTTKAYNGSACLHMKTRTTEAVIGDTICATRYGVQRPGKRYRLELMWTHVSSLLVGSLSFNVMLHDGVNNHHAKLSYDAENDKWRYYGTDGGYHDVPGGAQNLDEDSWHRLVMEFDQNKQEYIKMISDGLEIPLTGIKYYQLGGGSLVQLRVQFEIWALTAAACESYFDDVLLLEI